MNRINKILRTDSYKLSHFLQYPPNTLRVSSYIECRGVDKDFVPTDEIVHAGVQGFIHEYLTEPFTRAEVLEAADFAARHGMPFNQAGWLHIVEQHDGMLPIWIQALPEGTIMKPGTCQVQVVNTDNKVPWLTSYIETALLRAIWYPSTVATLSREIKKVMKDYLDVTSDNPGHLDFMLHDFGARGATSSESAAIGGAAHILNFMGSDTIEGIYYAETVLRAHSMPAFSIPAAEHSTITSWLEFGGEKAAFLNMVNQFGGDGKMYAVVSDSYNIWNAVENLWCGELYDNVINVGGRLVIRPDSGDPHDMVIGVIELAADKFGYTTNSKGFKVLNPAVRVVQGDGVNYYSIGTILETMKIRGWSAENVVFGMGGALLQKVNRDSLKYAMKASAIDVSGTWHDVYKDPVTDTGKRSKRGRLSVRPNGETVRAESAGFDDILRTQYLHAAWAKEINYDNFEAMRKRCAL